MMDRETRIAVLVDHYNRPRHKHGMDDADARIPGGNPGCGDLVTMYVRAEAGTERIDTISFEGAGCTISQAAASILADRVNKEHWTFAQALNYSPEQMMDLLGRDIVDARPGCATLALGTLKAAVKVIETDRSLRAAGKSDEEIRKLREEVAARAAGPAFVVGKEALELTPSPHEKGR
jgi:nitrogen fixation NifU-like protein